MNSPIRLKLILSALSVLSSIRNDMLDAPKCLLAWFNETLFSLLAEIGAPDNDKRWQLAIPIKGGKKGGNLGNQYSDREENTAIAQLERRSIDSLESAYSPYVGAKTDLEAVEVEVWQDCDINSALSLLLPSTITRTIGKTQLIARYVRSGLYDCVAIAGKEVKVACKGASYSAILAKFNGKEEEEARNMLDCLASAADARSKLVEEGYIKDDAKSSEIFGRGPVDFDSVWQDSPAFTGR